MPSELDESTRGFIRRVIREEYRPPERAYVVNVYEHTSNSDPWNHEVDVVLKGSGERKFEVPVSTPTPGAVTLPNDTGRNYSLSDRPGDPDFNGEGKQPTEKSDEKKPGNKPKDVDDRPECLVEYENGDPDAPVVTGWLYSDENRSPVGRVNDRRITVGDWVLELRTTEDGKQYGQLGVTDQPGDPVTRGFVVPPSGNPKILGSGGTDILAEARTDGGSSSGAGDGSGVLPDTDPTAPPADRASQAGIDIQTTKTVTSVAEIDGAPNTLYVVDGANGPLQHNGKHALGNVDHVAICGTNDAKLTVPGGFRDYSVTASGGTNFMWSGIDLDQTAPGAWGRLNFNIENAGYYESFRTIGSGVPADGSTGGGDVALHIPATSESGTVRMKNVSMIYGGRFQDEHEGNIGAIGIQFSPGDHNGTLNIADSQIEEFPNNAIYASACGGTVNATGSRLYNNGVSQYRASNGTIENCTVGYDYRNTGMANADAPNHAVVGIASEQKKDGRGGSVDVKNCTVEFLNVASTRGAIATYDIHSTGTFGTVEGADIVANNVGGAAHIHIGGRCGKIADCTFSGSESSGVCVVNQGPPIDTSGLTNNTPRGLGI